MVRDTVVGVIGALLIVGSMAGFIQIQVDDSGVDGDADQPGGVTGPPPQIGRASFSAEACTGMSLYWEPPLEDLETVVGPHWEPAPGGLPQRGQFWLFAFECDRPSVDGLRVSPQRGAAAIVPILEPDDTRNVTEADGWAAVPELMNPRGSPVAAAYRAHGFDVSTGYGSVGLQDTAVATQARMVVETDEGRLEATAAVTGQASDRSLHAALVGVSEDTFSVFEGSEEMDRRTTGQVLSLQTQGTTWVERLDLPSQPQEVWLDTGMFWDFDIFSEPWDPTGNATAS